MKDLLTPKQVANAIAVSESSLKRWCDKGLLPMVRTAGGHRRLQVNQVLEFIRRSGHKLVCPEVLGLPSSVGEGTRTLSRAFTQFEAALLTGDETQARRIVFDLYLVGRPAWEICDEIITRGMYSIGDKWQCGEAQVYEEHRACEISIRLLHELRAALPDPEPDAPLAIGGSWAGDPYRLPTTMCEIALREAGWNSQSLGASLPADTLHAAVERTQPRLCWISVSSIASEAEFITQFDQLFSFAHRQGTAVVVGGQALKEPIRRQIRFSAHCDNMRHLVAFAATLWSRPIKSTAG